MKSVVICGSGRYLPEILKFAEQLKRRNIDVFTPYVHDGSGPWISPPNQYKKLVALGLTHNHFYKIQIADVVFIYNKGGYIGNSTTLEIGYAVGIGKIIYALEGDDVEICRHVLIREITPSPESLAARLS